MATMRVEIDGELCIASGQCVYEAPEVFGFDDNRFTIVLDERPARPDAELVKVAELCPAQAILLFDEAGAPVELF